MGQEKQEEEQLRIRAIQLYQQGWKVSRICSSLARSRKWFYKWLDRWKHNGSDWFIEHSRAPKAPGNRVSLEIEEQIIDIREELIENPFMQYGPQAIYYMMIQKGLTPPPVVTIARILKRNGLTHKKKRNTYISKGKAYPYEYIECQQMDFVGPRYLGSKERFYFHSLICCETHWGQSLVFDSQVAENACRALINFWQIAGIPDFLQMDNYISFWGSLKDARSVGKLIRLCLLQKVTPVFIPVKEPWRNGIVEHYNKTMQNALIGARNFKSISELEESTAQFCKTHNEAHRYSTQEGMTPKQRMQYLNGPYRLLEQDYVLPEGKLPLEEGEIHIIRFIRSDLKFHLFGMSFPVPEKVKYEYVLGVVITHEHRLMIFRDQEYITEYPFIMY